MRKKISICMAVYNGEKFLPQQIKSILEQLQTQDEVIIIDDASQDNSASILHNINDSRVKITQLNNNAGVLSTFERSLRLATGDIIFLCDQDDIWHPEKINITLNAFSSNPEVTLTISDALVINESGEILSGSFFSSIGGFSSGAINNIIKNKYLGCAIAFRKEMLSYFLPIPSDIPMHDMWFGILNDIFGKTYFIEKPLISYRRHRNNLSPTSGENFHKKIYWRWSLIKNLLLRSIIIENRKKNISKSGT